MAPDTLIHPFTPADAAGLLAVERAVWNESPLDAGQVAALAACEGHAVWVAQVAGAGAGAVAGFVWCFASESAARGAGWELDVLAVAPAHRGLGLGRGLVRAACTAAEQRGVPACRAIVAQTNVASQHAFERAGFARSAELFDLLARSLPGIDAPARLPPPGPARRSVQLGPIEAFAAYTLLYSGLWLEQIPPGAGLGEAEAFARERGLAELTCLVPRRNWRLRDSLVRGGFRAENSYWRYARESAKFSP